MDISNKLMTAPFRRFLVRTIMVPAFCCALAGSCNSKTRAKEQLDVRIIPSCDHHLQTVLFETLAERFSELLEDEDREVRKSAAKSLIGLHAPAVRYLPNLIRAVAYDIDIRDMVLEMVDQMPNRGLPQLLRAMRDKDHRGRLGALRLLQFTGTHRLLELDGCLPKEHWTPLLEGLRDKDAEVRLAAVDAILSGVVHTSEADVRVIPALIRALKDDEDELVREQCATTLGNMGERARSAAPALNEVLRKAGAEHEMAAWALARTGDSGREFLIKILDDPKMAQCHRAVLRVIPKLTCDKAPMVQHVGRFLKSDDDDVLIEAIRCLQRLGPTAKPAEAKLRKLFACKDMMVAVEAVWALAEVGVSLDDSSVAVMTKAIYSESSDVQWHAFRIINFIGDKGAKLVPRLVLVLQDKQHEKMRFLAARSLGFIGKPAKVAIPALKHALADDSKRVREEAKSALERIEADCNE
jgi:HEAT repeat protein